MNKKKILRNIDKYWDTALSSLHNTSPKDKNLPTTSGLVEENMHRLYNKHRENMKELFEELFVLEVLPVPKEEGI